MQYTLIQRGILKYFRKMSQEFNSHHGFNSLIKMKMIMMDGVIMIMRVGVIMIMMVGVMMMMTLVLMNQLLKRKWLVYL